MSKKKKEYDPKALFLQGLLAFGSSAIFSGWTKPTYTAVQSKWRREKHAKFKAQCAARREQRRLSAAR